jgi:hypothetical protein
MDNTNSGLKKILVIDDEGALHRTPYGGHLTAEPATFG